MKLVITPEEAAKLDAAADDPVETLMERAGLAVALAAVEMGVAYGWRVAVLCGKGNNGGDGYVAARYLLQRGAGVTVYALGEPQPGSAAGAARLRAMRAGARIRPLAAPEPADLVIDALWGVGFSGRLPESVLAWLEHPAPVLAVDVPSGLDAADGTAERAFTAARTVTFHALKPGHLLGSGPERCGVVSVADIGLSGGDPLFRVTEDGDAPRPTRPRTAHKWSAGSVAVVGGSPGLVGAAVLAGRSALAMGAGAVSLVVPGEAQPAAAAGNPQLLTRGFGEASFRPADADAVLSYVARFDVVVLGPGLGPDQREFVAEVLYHVDGGLVVDADALNALDGTDSLAARPGPTVITPHLGELRRLVGADADWATAADLPDQTGAVVVLKGNPSFVLGAERWIVTSGGQELATIGTGDVLAGALGALWARGLEPEVAARSAAHWHGRAGAALAHSGTVTADALADEMTRWAW